MILFLDFDGVLHPERGEALFNCLPPLRALLRACPHVEVVFSTSWREMYRPDELFQFVLPSKAVARIWPIILSGVRLSSSARSPTRCAPYKHEQECRAWLEGSGLAARPWLVLDDYVPYFTPDCSALYLVDPRTGLTVDDVSALIAKVK